MTREPETNASSNGRYVVPLRGCEPTPLASYLKALGILRLVAEQTMGSVVRGWWTDSAFHLESHLDRDQLKEFFLQRYEPTPILGPWNGGSGFYPKDNTDAVDPIRAGTARRYTVLRSTIEEVAALISRKGLEKRPDAGPAKTAFLTELRNTVDDRYLDWIDAAVTLSEEDVLYPPLLGTGGNDGRLDFTNNFMKNLVRLIDPDTGAATEGADDLIDDALFGTSVPGLESSAIGQFAPGAAGGPNAESGFAGSSQVNPWDFVLMIEGSILLAANTARRVESRGKGVLAYPFTVRSTGAGSGGTAPADEGQARAESWMPLWSRAASLAEVRHILSEGRIVVNQRMSGDGLDAVRAIAKLGADRGIDAFERFGYLQRSGLAYLATPLGRIGAQRNPNADLIDDLERGGWLRRFRRLGGAKGAPARLSGLLHQLEDSLFALAQTPESPTHVQRCLVALGHCQGYLVRSPRSREDCPPVPELGEEWVTRADDGTPEFRIAAGLASLRGFETVGPATTATRSVLTTAEYMAPLRPSRPRRWADGSSARFVWARGALDRNLGRMMARRMIDQKALRLEEIPLHGSFRSGATVVAEWLARPTWDRRIGELIEGLALVGRFPTHRLDDYTPDCPIPAAYTLLKPFFVPRSQLTRVLSSGRGPARDVVLPPPAEIVRLLLSDERDRALRAGQATLRSKGLTAPRAVPATTSGSGARLLAALMLPVVDRDLRSLFRTLFTLTGEQPQAEAVPLLTQEG